MKKAWVFLDSGLSTMRPVLFETQTKHPDGTVYFIADPEGDGHLDSHTAKVEKAFLIGMGQQELFDPEGDLASYVFVVLQEDIPATVKQLRELADYLKTLE